MTTQYTPILKLALPVEGELDGSWGDVVNDNITSMVEQAVAGRVVINTWSTNSHTLTTANGTTAEARCAMLSLTDSGTQLSAAGTVICPALSKIYIVQNAAGQIITVKTASGSGIAIPNGATAFVFCDGTNVLECLTSMTALSVTGNVYVGSSSQINTENFGVTGQAYFKNGTGSGITPTTDSDDVVIDSNNGGRLTLLSPAAKSSRITTGNPTSSFYGWLDWDAAGIFTARVAGATALTINASQNATFAGTITGDGSGLTALNGSNISTGTVAAARVATLNQDTTGASGSVATADESSDTTCFITFATEVSGNLPMKTGTNLLFNSSTGVVTSTDYTVTSDRRLKKNINDMVIDWDRFKQYRTVTHEWIEGRKGVFSGLIAQEVQAIDPTLIEENKNSGMLSVNYNKIVPELIKTIQDLNARLEALENK